MTATTEHPPDTTEHPPDAAPCEDCHTNTANDELTTLEHGEVCETCAADWTTCEECSHMVNVHNVEVVAFAGDDYCLDCYLRTFRDCLECGDTTRQDCMSYNDNLGGDLCETCAADWTTCSVCDRDVRFNNCHEFGSESLCYRCYSQNVFDCAYCGDCYWADDGPHCSCDDEDEASATIEGYGYKPTPQFFGYDPKGAYLGLELELEARDGNRNEMAEMVGEALGNYGYLKADGSLCNGFEIVTHPATLGEHLGRFPFDALRQLASMGARSWDGGTECGVHVHVSRNTFTAAHLGRFLWLVYNNAPQWRQIAGRHSERWAPYDDSTRCRIGKIAKKAHYPSRRYSAVNLTNSSTVEVRVFRGSLNAATVTGYLASVAASVEYTRNACACHVAATGFDGFRTWANEQGDTYRPFLELADRKIA